MNDALRFAPQRFMKDMMPMMMMMMMSMMPVMMGQVSQMASRMPFPSTSAEDDEENDNYA